METMLLVAAAFFVGMISALYGGLTEESKADRVFPLIIAAVCAMASIALFSRYCYVNGNSHPGSIGSINAGVVYQVLWQKKTEDGSGFVLLRSIAGKPDSVQLISGKDCLLPEGTRFFKREGGKVVVFDPNRPCP